MGDWKKSWNEYLDSFKFGKRYFTTLLIDGGFVLLIAGLFFSFSSLVSAKSQGILQGKAPEQLQQYLLSASPEQLQSVYGSLQAFLFTSIGGIIILSLATLFLCSLARALIWNLLIKKKLTKQTYWRWNLLNLALIIPLVGFLVGYVVVKFVLVLIVGFITSNPAPGEIIAMLINIVFIVFVLNFFFLTYYGFVRRYKVWESIGQGFEELKNKFGSLYKMMSLQVITVIIISVAISLILKYGGKLFLLPASTGSVVNVVMSLLIVAWIRIYTFKAVS